MLTESRTVHFKVILKFWMRGPTRGSDNKKKLDGRVVVITGEVVQLEGVIFMRKHNKKQSFSTAQVYFTDKYN